eukprot:4045821-Pyramimonas_sp.AAC.2
MSSVRPPLTSTCRNIPPIRTNRTREARTYSRDRPREPLHLRRARVAGGYVPIEGLRLVRRRGVSPHVTGPHLAGDGVVGGDEGVGGVGEGIYP